MVKRKRHKSLFFLLLFLFAAQVLFSQKTDVIFLLNGDRITCEIKILEYGQLKVKTDDIGTIYVDWKNIDRMISANYFEIELTDGSKYFGFLIDSEKLKKIRISLFDSSFVDLETDGIVRINQILEQLSSRINASVDLGFNIMKANKLSSLTLGGKTDYRSRINYYSATFNSVFTQQLDSIQNQRADLDFRFNRFFKNRWLLEAYTTLQHNSELGLDLRILAGGGPGRHILQTNEVTINALAGAVFNQEWNKGVKSSFNLEGWLRLEYRQFFYSSPKVDILSQLEYFPSFTKSGRHRIEFYTKAKREIANNLFLGLNIQYSFDSRSPSTDGKSDDWNVSFSIGWTL